MIDTGGTCTRAPIDSVIINFLVSGHKGRLVFGLLAGKCVLCMQGRVHGYEGYSQKKVGGMFCTHLVVCMTSRFVYV